MAGEFLYDKASATPAKYRFSLLNPDSNELIRLTPDHPPIEWETGEIEVKRDINVGGVFNTFVIDSLTFIKEGAHFLRKIWNEKEINGRCYLIVEYFKNTTKSYVEMPSRFSLNFATAKPYVKVGNTSIGFEIEASKDDILVKLENRRNKDVDLAKTYTRNGEPYIKSMGGAELKDYASLNKNVNFGAISVKDQTSWIGIYNGGSNFGNINNSIGVHIFTTFDMKFRSNDIEGTSEVSWQTDLKSVDDVPFFFINDNSDRTIKFSYYFGIEVTNRENIFNRSNRYATIVDILNEDGSIAYSERVQDVGKTKGLKFANGIIEYELMPFQKIRIYVQTDATFGINAYIRRSTFVLIQEVVSYSSRTIEGFPIYETTERALQLILDIQFPLYTNFFGRTDVIWNKNGDTYASEDQRRFASVMSGLNLRGALLSDDNNPMPSKFDDIFDSVNSLWNIGYQVETIDGEQRIRIENYDWFFDDILALDLSARLSIYDIETESMPELAYSQVKTGFKDYTYEKINGRDEFNTESSYTSVINTDTTYKIVSEIRADTMGITAKIAEKLTTEDTEEDNELFIIKTQRDIKGWKPEKTENVTINNDSSIFGSDAFNLYFTPARMLKRHGNRLKGAFLKYLQTYFSFQTSNKLQTLETTGEGYTITENQDILVNSLDNAIYKPIKHTVECVFTFDDFETFMANPKGYIKLSDSISGYLLSLKKSNNEDKAVIEIIEKV